MYFYDLSEQWKGYTSIFFKEKGEDKHDMEKDMENNNVYESPKYPVRKTIQGMGKEWKG